MPDLRAVPDRPDPEVYGFVEFVADTSKPPLKLSIGVYYGGPLLDYTEDILIGQDGLIVRHTYDSYPRESTEEERAAVGWTW